jgi:hypothetical protein
MWQSASSIPRTGAPGGRWIRLVRRVAFVVASAVLVASAIAAFGQGPGFRYGVAVEDDHRRVA